MSVLRKAWQVWRAFGRFMGDLVGRVVMTLFYFTVALPFGLAARFISDPLRLKSATPRWIECKRARQALDDARRMF